MTNDRTANIFGALALAVVDTLLREAQAKAPEPGPAAAAISLLTHEPGMSIDRLRRALSLSHPGAVRLADRLVADGVMIRETSERDRRAVALNLTEKGRTACANIRAARMGSLDKLLGLLDVDERAILGVLAEKLLTGIVGSEDHAYSVCRLCDEGACTSCPVNNALRSTGVIR